MDNQIELISFSSTPIETEIDDVFGTFGFQDKNGNVIIEPQYASVGEFSHGLCPVCLNRTWYRTTKGERYYETHWGYINTAGKMVIPLKFREAFSFNKYGVAVVTDEYTSSPYLIDLNGNMIEGSKFPYLSHYYEYDDRFLPFSPNPNWGNNCENANDTGLYDTKERKIMFPPVAEDFTEYDEDCILVYEKVEHGPYDFRQRYINSQGENLFPWQVGKDFSIVEKPNPNGLSIVAKSFFYDISDTNPKSFFPWNGKKYERIHLYGVLDNNGVLVIPTEYTKISEQTPNTFKCQKENKCDIITV